MNNPDDITPEGNREVIICMDETLKLMTVAVMTMYDRMNMHMELINTLERKIGLMKKITNNVEPDLS